MPSSIIQSFAKQSGKSVSKVEDMWNKIESSVKKQYPDKKGDDFYKAVVGILKKSLNINEEDSLERKAEMDQKKYLQDKIRKLQDDLSNSKDPLKKKAINSKIKVYQQRMREPLFDEDIENEEAAITTTSMGSGAYHRGKVMPTVSRIKTFHSDTEWGKSKSGSPKSKNKKYEAYLDSKIN